MTENKQAAKEYLESYYLEMQDIRKAQEELKELNEIDSGMSIDTSKEHVQSSCIGDATGDTAAKIADLKTKINNMLNDAVDILTEIEKTIDFIDSEEKRLIIVLRYIRRQKWDDIADKMHYNVRTIYNLHDEALEEIYKIIQ